MMFFSAGQRLFSERAEGNSVTVVRPVGSGFVSNMLHLEERGKETAHDVLFGNYNLL